MRNHQRATDEHCYESTVTWVYAFIFPLRFASVYLPHSRYPRVSPGEAGETAFIDSMPILGSYFKFPFCFF